MKTFGFTDKGPRPINEDFYCLEMMDGRLLAAVADGVGGNNGGEVASRLVIEYLIKHCKAGVSLSGVLHSAHQYILDKANEASNLYGMATTLTAILYENNFINGVHSGDSRAYILRKNGIKQLTEDHTELARLMRDGRITKEESINYPRKNILKNAIGIHENFNAQPFEFQIKTKDRLLLLTDGVYGKITKKEVRDLSVYEEDFNIFCNKIIELISERKTNDNFTLVGIEFD